MQPIVIAGGGIGGLAAALGLARKGVRSIVLESAPELGEIGAGIQLAPKAFHCFDYLGVGDQARRRGVHRQASPHGRAFGRGTPPHPARRAVSGTLS